MNPLIVHSSMNPLNVTITLEIGWVSRKQLTLTVTSSGGGTLVVWWWLSDLELVDPFLEALHPNVSLRLYDLEFHLKLVVYLGNIGYNRSLKCIVVLWGDQTKVCLTWISVNECVCFEAITQFLFCDIRVSENKKEYSMRLLLLIN